MNFPKLHELKSLKSHGRKAPKLHTRAQPPRLRGIMFVIVLSALSVLLFDVSSARIRYHYLISSELRPLKDAVLVSRYSHHGSIPSELQNCRAYDRNAGDFVTNCTLAACEQNALLLSEKRQTLLHVIREAHPSSRIFAETFDGARGVNQSLKIANLFARKTCEAVMDSSDRTNWVVDFVCFSTFPVAVYLLWVVVHGVRGSFGVH